jgi:RNA polymerase sigma-70 factor (ECF subfamily)
MHNGPCETPIVRHSDQDCASWYAHHYLSLNCLTDCAILTVRKPTYVGFSFWKRQAIRLAPTMSSRTPIDPEKWVAQHGDALYRFALTRVRNPEVAEDLVQETFAAGLGGLDKYSGRSSERTWLVGILKHKIADHFRKTAREQVLEDTDSLAQDDDLFDEKGHWRVGPEKWGESPAKTLENKEFWKVFETCVDGLPARLRQAFALRALDGVDSGQVCKVLGISATNLWVILHRARSQLRRCLELNWFGGKENETWG